MDLFKAVTDKNSRIVMTREVWTDHTSFTSQIFGLSQSNLLLHPNSLDELAKIKIKGEKKGKISHATKDTNTKSNRR